MKMKKQTALFLTIAIACILSAIGIAGGMNADANESKVDIKTLWKDYEAARKADKPQSQLDILERIISKAEAERLTWDFYEGWQNKLSVETSRNWKLYDTLQKAMNSAYAAYGDPVLDVVALSAGIDTVKARKQKLMSVKNSGFYESGRFWGVCRGAGIYGKALAKLINNDYEFALWYMLGVQYGQEQESLAEDIRREIALVAGAKSMQASFADFDRTARKAEALNSIASKQEEYGAYSGKWAPSAAALMADETLLQLQMDTLEHQKGVSSDRYVHLRTQCSEFEKKRAAFKNTEKLIAEQCLQAKNLIERLDSKDILLASDSTSVTVYFRNIQQAELTLSYEEAGKTTDIYSETVKNPVKSYYALDSLVIPVPVKDDGHYIIKAQNGNLKAECDIIRYSISAALTKDDRGWTVYAADYDSGEPLKQYDLKLYDGSSRQELVASYDDFRQGNGLSFLPAAFASKIQNDSRNAQYVKCSFIDTLGVLHSSAPVRLNASTVKELADDNGLKAVILTDCSAFHRGDVLHCKAVVYKGAYYSEMAVAAKNTPITVTLSDPEDNVIDKKTVKTNDFGSVTADFKIPGAVRGGSFRLNAATSDGVSLTDTHIVVDDFVLPDFECVFDKIDSLYFVGDSVTVSGRVKAYSGHGINVSRAYYTVAGMDGSQKAVIASDGSFAIKVPTPRNRFWGTAMTLVVHSSTGETLQFTKTIPVGRVLDLRVELENRIESSMDGYLANTEDGDEMVAVLSDTLARFRAEVFNADAQAQALAVQYGLCKGKTLLQEGRVTTPGEVLLQLPDADGEYKVVFTASAKDDAGVEVSRKINVTLIKLQEGSKSLDADIENIFIPRADGRNIGFEFASTHGPVWAVAALYGPQGQQFYCDLLHLEGQRGREGSVLTVSLPYSKDYPDFIRMRVFYFKHGKLYQWTHQYNRPVVGKSMDIAWTRSRDYATPGTEYTFTLKANPGSEAAVAIFDKSTETVSTNYWVRVSGRNYPFNMPLLNSKTGEMSGTPYYRRFGAYRTKDIVVMNAAAPYQMVEEKASPGIASDELVTDADVRARSDFSTTLCWQPQIKVPSSGEVNVKFKTSDKTGTFVVNAFVHDKTMLNAVLRREMVVALPLEISVAPPAVLYDGDKYAMNVALSAMAEDVAGILAVEAVGVGIFSRDVQLQRDSVCTIPFTIAVPSGISALPVKVTFTDRKKRFNDAVAFEVKVNPAKQVIKEAHSAVLQGGQDRQELWDALSAQFVNTTAQGAMKTEINVMDMLRAVLDTRVTVKGCSAIDLTDAVSAILLGARLRGGAAAAADSLATGGLGSLLDDLKEFHNADGGYAWIEGMDSSPVVTATLLERCAKVRAGSGSSFLTEEEIAAAVAYLDGVVLSGKWQYGRWCAWNHGISLSQYLYVRSFYPSVGFNVKSSAADKEAFIKSVKNYLFPSDARGLNGKVFEKTLRLSTLENIYSMRSGRDLLKGWGLPAVSTRSVLQSLEADVESLTQYAVAHPSGGIYYPNLVMPYRGLLSDEAYCHSLLSDLMENYNPEISDGIRLWLMLQKETQKWEANFSFVNAVASIMNGSESMKNTSVLVLSKSYEKPYDSLKAAGNGFTISRSFQREADGGKMVDIAPGDTLRTGDRLVAKYSINNAENRSFVRVSVPRHGCLRPVDQLSGRIGWWLRPMSYAGGFFAPQGYREVRSDKTVYWFDSYPEEKSVITEEYFVTQAGVFTSPVVEIESLYAPHYRANGAYEGEFVSSSSR